ncbi:MAG: TetR/AcrR family transcriptional regulator [Bacteroidetes bacterium]|nr:TetR/AcrR family transcriptional regulator [Bacteroidota bacterium]
MKLETEIRILVGAEELFSRFGIKNVTMDEIARHLGMSKKTIYLHYIDKNKLVQAVVNRMIQEHDIQCKEFESKSDNAISEIFLIMNYMNAFFSQINPNLFFDMQRYHPEAWKYFIKFKEEVILEHVIGNLEKGRKEELYRKDFSLKILARLRIEEIEMAMSPQYFSPNKYNLQEVQIQLLDHFLHGICTIKGHKLFNQYKQLQEDE